MNIKIKQLFWSTDRDRTRLCLSHGSGGQRGPRRRRPEARSGRAATPRVLLRAEPGGSAESTGPKEPGQLSRLPSPRARPLTGWRAAPENKAPSWGGQLRARSCSSAFAGGIFFFFFRRCQRNRQDPASSDKSGSYYFTDFKLGLETLRSVDPCE